MKKVQLRDAKANLSRLVDAVERGETITLTRHGKPAAALVPVDSPANPGEADEKAASDFADFLLSFPDDLEGVLTGDRPAIRDVDI